MPRPGPNVTSDADTQPGSDSLFPTGFSGGGALVRSGSVGTGEIADGSVAAADLNLASVAAAIAARSEMTGTYARMRSVDMLTQGAAADGATDDWAIFTAARTSAGGKGVVRFPAKPGSTTTTYYFASGTAGANPDLSGCLISADPGVVISVNGCDLVSYRALSLTTPLTLTVRNRTSTITLPPTVAPSVPDPALSLGTPANVIDDMTLSTLDFTTWAKRNYVTSNGSSGSTTGTSTLTTRQVAWAGTETANSYEGVFYTGWRVGDEVTVTAKATSDNVSGEFAAHINASGEYVFVTFGDSRSAQGLNNRKFLRKRKTGTAAPVTEKTGNVPDASYGPQAASWIQLSARIISSTQVEVLVNGLRVDTVTMTGPIEDIGFTVDCPYYSARSVLMDPVLKRRPNRAAGGKTLNLAVLGDSQSFGEGNSVNWPDYLVAFLRGQPGVSDVSVTNYAHSGDAASATNTIAQATSFAAFDAVLVLTGTNDINAATTQSSFETSLTAIGNKIVSDGSIPVIGIPPMYTFEPPNASSPTRANYGKGAPVRSSVAWVCATNGWQLAETLTGLGAVGVYTYPSTTIESPQMFDGLHPNALGAVFLARAFGRAVVRALTKVGATLIGAERMDGIVHVDYGTAAPTTGTWAVGDRRYNTAVAAAGTLGWVCTTAGTPGTWKTFGGVAA